MFQNTYLIAINVTNKQKERYYHEYVPDLLDVSSPEESRHPAQTLIGAITNHFM